MLASRRDKPLPMHHPRNATARRSLSPTVAAVVGKRVGHVMDGDSIAADCAKNQSAEDHAGIKQTSAVSPPQRLQFAAPAKGGNRKRLRHVGESNPVARTVIHFGGAVREDRVHFCCRTLIQPHKRYKSSARACLFFFSALAFGRAGCQADAGGELRCIKYLCIMIH